MDSESMANAEAAASSFISNRVTQAMGKSLSGISNSKWLTSAWMIWGLGAAFFVSEYFSRVAPSVMINELMRDFQANALSLGSLSAFFYYTYVAMQVPVGMLVDRFGPHRLLTLMAFLSAISSFLFGYATTLVLADSARFLFGFAASFAFVGTLKLASVWFPPSRFGLLAGLTQALGMIGAAVGGPLSYLVSVIGWRHTMGLIGIIFVVLAVFIGLVVKDSPTESFHEEKNPEVSKGLWTGLRIVLANRQSWLNAIYAGLVYAPTAAFAELWGPTYLARAYHLSMHVAATAVGMIFIGWGIGGPLLGYVSDKIQRRRPIMLASAAIGFVLMSTIIYVPGLPVPLLFLLLFLFGVSNTGVATAYAVAAEINPRPIAGTSMAFANMASVIIGAAFQPIIGWLLDLQWDGTIENGIPLYSVSNFEMSLIQLPVCLALGIFFAYKVKETYCKPIE